MADITRLGAPMTDPGASPTLTGGDGVKTPAILTLADVVASLERRAAEAEREGATAPVANVYRAILDQLRVVDSVVAALVVPVAMPDRAGLERHLTAEQVEELLQLPNGYAYDHKGQLGGVKVGKYLRFPESLVRRRLDRRR